MCMVKVDLLLPQQCRDCNWGKSTQEYCSGRFLNVCTIKDWGFHCVDHQIGFTCNFNNIVNHNCSQVMQITGWGATHSLLPQPLHGSK